ncbi:tetratricopeptide repeat protein [Diaphorobacter ruginosibacter]|uniref:Tetratricopeptide repeat protein n=1 Tax=Diaphorobacter ruginosibacter TaxID=1715720 RepID=A0A7G9RK02_9BURK|nr:tetratricopeptide repeat protein [Diaphorobacter ruginosibacter]QNN55927.1 tetratricopeptide repeat protein [Diaphorobacter ruginosibacter]
MNDDMTTRLEAMLASGKETSLLRFTLGKNHFDAGHFTKAREHLERAVELDPNYSVAWKFLGKACLELGDFPAARKAWDAGLACAEARGDAQVVKELGVFLRRLDKASG